MMKFSIIIYICLGACFIGTSCAYDNVEELFGKRVCPPGDSSFEDTIKPIVNSNCAISGCSGFGYYRK